VDPPRLETEIHFGALDFLSRVLTAWYSTTPDKTLILKLSVKYLGSAISRGAAPMETPELATTTST
jgi:hypothetical protein